MHTGEKSKQQYKSVQVENNAIDNISKQKQWQKQFLSTKIMKT